MNIQIVKHFDKVRTKSIHNSCTALILQSDNILILNAILFLTGIKFSSDTQKNCESINALGYLCANANIKAWTGFLGPKSINECLNKIGTTLKSFL